MTSENELSFRERRRKAFVDHLGSLANDLTSGKKGDAQAARRKLAQLRRSVTGNRYENEALATVFECGPPQDEEHIWLFIAGLFALNPQNGSSGLPLGTALRELDRQRVSSTAQKRLRQLLAADAHALPHHLRQSLQLLASHDIAVDFHALLDDAVTLMRRPRDEERARDVRWKWARDFHRERNSTPKDDNGKEPQESDQ
ncbi:type I-E CRISPR-associated protein Cse2/CasB [Saccharopolyspora hordei]|uniref:CRISPR system Cascade subunit CasB n=1 Tax=Saccharopolyspora hordei TaxID=1838 RepID=A0A853AG80_9PSEU|nr:type I-E CRISPR-associated protein Cse2/CasB [Saccharopolyspora hordei]NYI83562.1 CRISPR system Cascade subunit CasB [Saccharopolyspora hordei]